MTKIIYRISYISVGGRNKNKYLIWKWTYMNQFVGIFPNGASQIATVMLNNVSNHLSVDFCQELNIERETWFSPDPAFLFKQNWPSLVYRNMTARKPFFFSLSVLCASHIFWPISLFPHTHTHSYTDTRRHTHSPTGVRCPSPTLLLQPLASWKASTAYSCSQPWSTKLGHRGARNVSRRGW